MGILRTRTPRVKLEIFGGIATAKKLSDNELKEIRENFELKDGSFDFEKVAYEVFRRTLVNLEEFKDEDEKPLVLDAELKETLIEHDSDFFQEFMQKSKEAFDKREDLATKNSLPGAGGSSLQKKKKNSVSRAKSAEKPGTTSKIVKDA